MLARQVRPLWSPFRGWPFCRQRVFQVPKAVSTSARLSLLAAFMALTLSQVQTHAEATVAETLSATTSTPAQAVSSNTAATTPTSSWALPKECHPWARFEVGSWREIEVTTETFDEQGNVFGRSVTTQKEILKAIADDSYVIDVQATVDVAGKRIAGPWNTRVLRLCTDRPGAIFKSAQKQDELLPLNVGATNCQVFEVQYSDESRNLCDRIYFSSEVFPHVLHRDTVEQSENSPIANSPEYDMSIIAREVPFEWEGRMIDCVTQQVIRRHEKGESQTLSLLSPEIPGGEIRSHATDFDVSGKRIRWSVQRLLGYGTTHTSDGAEATVTSFPATNEQK